MGAPPIEIRIFHVAITSLPCSLTVDAASAAARIVSAAQMLTRRKYTLAAFFLESNLAARKIGPFKITPGNANTDHTVRSIMR